MTETKQEAIIKILNAYNDAPVIALFKPETEYAVIGSVLHDTNNYAQLADILTPAEFSDRTCAYIWHAFTELTAQGREIDYLTVSQVVPTLKGFTGDEDMILDICARCMAAVPRLEHVMEYAKMVVENATRLRLVKVGDEIRTTATNKTISITEVIAQVEHLTYSSTRRRTEHATDLESLSSTYYDRIESGMQGDYTSVIPSGYLAHDTIAHGYLKGEIHVIAGGAGAGKTTWLLSQLRLLAKRLREHNKLLNTDQRIVHFTMEMSAAQCIEKWVMQETGIAQWKLRQPKSLSADERRTFTHAIGEISNWPIEIVDEFGSLRPVQLRTRTRRYMQDFGVTIVTVDGLWLCEPDEAPRKVVMQADGHIHYYLTMRIAEIASDFEIPIVLLHQYNQDAKTRRSKIPVLTDMKWGQAVQQDFHTIWGMYRPRGTEGQTIADSRYVQFYGLKGRSNSALEGSKYELYFDDKYTLYRDLTMGEALSRVSHG